MKTTAEQLKVLATSADITQALKKAAALMQEHKITKDNAVELEASDLAYKLLEQQENTPRPDEDRPAEWEALHNAVVKLLEEGLAAGDHAETFNGEEYYRKSSIASGIQDYDKINEAVCDILQATRMHINAGKLENEWYETTKPAAEVLKSRINEAISMIQNFAQEAPTPAEWAASLTDEDIDFIDELTFNYEGSVDDYKTAKEDKKRTAGLLEKAARDYNNAYDYNGIAETVNDDDADDIDERDLPDYESIRELAEAAEDLVDAWNEHDQARTDLSEAEDDLNNLWDKLENNLLDFIQEKTRSFKFYEGEEETWKLEAAHEIIKRRNIPTPHEVTEE